MPQRLIQDQSSFEDLCAHIRSVGLVAFDTEFVSEYTYRPELGLMQFATDERLVAVDPYAVQRLDNWWDIMADDQTTVVVHGGQAEARFCQTFSGQFPKRLIDVQIAEGLHSRSYPLGYSALVRRVLGTRVHGKETRTDWRRRPLSPSQIRYALEDVEHLLPVWGRQQKSLERLNRLEWAEAEFGRMIDELSRELTRDVWSRLPGIHKLGRRELAVARELAEWREREAERRDRPPRRILRDDLLVDMARRQPKSHRELTATRDMNRSDYRANAEHFLDCVKRAIDLPDAELPSLSVPPNRNDTGRDEHVLGQLLGLALSNQCAAMNIAKPLVGTTSDLKALARWHVFDNRRGEPPRLATGWRAEVCGDILTDLLDGKTALRIGDPYSDHPLVFERSSEAD